MAKKLVRARLMGDRIIRYVTAGKARFTIQNKESGGRFTYKLRANRGGNVFFVSLLTGPDNSHDYQYVGYISRGSFKHGGEKTRISPMAPSVIAFRWFWKNKEILPEKVEVYHEGVCGSCGKGLTVPESIERGLGPKCAGVR